MQAPLLVIGRNGQLARCLVETATAGAIAVVAAGRPDCDIAERASVLRLVERHAPRVIINAAAFTAVDAAEEQGAAAFAVNETGAGNVAFAAARARVPLLHVSTDYVFDGRASSPYLETDAPAPLNVYGRSKLAGERAVLDMLPAALVLRTCWLYSAYGHNFVRTMVSLAGRPSVSVVDDQRGSPTSAHDLAEAILSIVAQVSAREFSAGGVYHVSAAGETTWHGLAERIFEEWRALGHRVPRLARISTAEYGARAPRPAYSVLDNSKLRRTFGVVLPDWQPALARVVRALHAETN